MPEINGVKNRIVSADRNLKDGGRPAIAQVNMGDRELRNARASNQIRDPLRQ